MPKIPRDPSFDSTLDLLREGYPFLQNRFRRLGTDIFLLRLMGQKAICLHGPAAARLFYNPALFMREGAVPRRVQTTLMGKDGVQTLDGDQHRCRKDLFMSLMGPGSRHRLLEVLLKWWQTYAQRWEQKERVVLFMQAQEILCRGACEWAGVPLHEEEVRQRARDFGRMVDGFGGVGPRHARGKQARNRGEKWMRGIIRQVRRGEIVVPEGCAAHAMAWHREPDGNLLSVQMAAVELMNVLRPIVAIATYSTFAAVALHEYPPYRGLLRSQEGYAELFVQEVRRYFPFTPFVGARVRKNFEWQGFKFSKGTLVLLDVYGLSYDERRWQDPEVFWPDRFRHWQQNAFDFIPQGGGHYENGHRCAGEWITIEVLKQAVHFLNEGIAYEVPAQNLQHDLSRMPALPPSGFIMTNVRRLAAAPAPKVVACPFHH